MAEAHRRHAPYCHLQNPSKPSRPHELSGVAYPGSGWEGMVGRLRIELRFWDFQSHVLPIELTPHGGTEGTRTPFTSVTGWRLS